MRGKALGNLNAGPEGGHRADTELMEDAGRLPAREQEGLSPFRSHTSSSAIPSVCSVCVTLSPRALCVSEALKATWFSKIFLFISQMFSSETANRYFLKMEASSFPSPLADQRYSRKIQV